LHLLLPDNQTQTLRLAFVQKKIAFETKGVSGRNAGKSRLVSTDRFSNVI
jgi:hypothetical protein